MPMNALEFAHIVRRNPTNQALLERLPEAGLKDVWLVSGALFQTVWNVKTERPPSYGIKDYDLFYFDGDDLSWEGEDTKIRQAMRTFKDIDADIEIRNQARVHLWYEEKFGLPYEPLRQTTDGIDRFLAVACMVGITCTAGGEVKVYAPSSFADLEQLLVRPNPLKHFDAETYSKKARRWQRLWPELRIEDVA